MEKDIIEELLEKPYWIVDILPKQVPADSPGQYFRMEEYWTSEDQFSAIKQKHIDLVLRLNCYADISLDEEDETDPSPERIAQEMRSRYVCIMTGSSMIVSQPDETYLTVYDPDDELLDIIRDLAFSVGMFVWQP